MIGLKTSFIYPYYTRILTWIQMFLKYFVLKSYIHSWQTCILFLKFDITNIFIASINKQEDIYIYIYIYIYMNIYNLYIYIYVCVCVYVWVGVCVYVCVCVCARARVCVGVFMCIMLAVIPRRK